MPSLSHLGGSVPSDVHGTPAVFTREPIRCDTELRRRQKDPVFHNNSDQTCDICHSMRSQYDRSLRRVASFAKN
jgi:hypothetical protein